MGNFFGSSIGGKLHKKIIPKELKKLAPKEITPSGADAELAKEFGEPLPEAPPGSPPPEQIDVDAYRTRNRARRRARAASTIRTSASGASYSPAPKSLLGG